LQVDHWASKINRGYSGSLKAEVVRVQIVLINIAAALGIKLHLSMVNRHVGILYISRRASTAPIIILSSK